jgi:predicted nuclease of restriction endonuclease-like (RecB) superfamily
VRRVSLVAVTTMIPADYGATLDELKRHVHDARFRAQRKANTELLRLWWRVGSTILERQQREPWGSGVLERLADDLRAEFPSMKGFSRANLFSMRRFAAAWPDEESIVQRPVGQLPWGHVIELLDKLDDQGLRDWYAAQDVSHGWSRPVLVHQIRTRLHEREAAAPSNYAAVLAATDSELAQQITRDPYALDFLAIDGDSRERDLEDRLVGRITDTLRELGPGFTFVARQMHFEVDGDDFFVDLVFFHVEQLRYIVVELKTTKFEPRDAGQLGFYVALVDDRLRIPEKHGPTIGILVVTDKNDAVVRYSLASTTQPVAVSRYELAEDARAALPDEASLLDVFSGERRLGPDARPAPSAEEEPKS